MAGKVTTGLVSQCLCVTDVQQQLPVCGLCVEHLSDKRSSCCHGRLLIIAFLFSDNPKLERIGEDHLSHFASVYNRMETNRPAQDQFISFTST